MFAHDDRLSFSYAQNRRIRNHQTNLISQGDLKVINISLGGGGVVVVGVDEGGGSSGCAAIEITYRLTIALHGVRKQSC